MNKSENIFTMKFNGSNKNGTGKENIKFMEIKNLIKVHNAFNKDENLINFFNFQYKFNILIVKKNLSSLKNGLKTMGPKKITR